MLKISFRNLYNSKNLINPMKKGVIISVAFGMLLISSMFYLEHILSARQLQFSPIEFAQEIPQTCSSESLKEAWSQIFQESSDNITIIIDETSASPLERNGDQITRCSEYLAYKIKNDEELYVLYGSFSPAMPETTFLNAIKANVTLDLVSIMQNTTISSQNFLLGNENTMHLQYLKENSQSQEEAATTLETTFKIDPLITWESNTGVGEPNLIILIQNVTQNITINQENYTAFETNVLISSLSNTLMQLSFTETLAPLQVQGPPIICQSLWISQNSSCKNDETYIIWYNDTNACNTSNPPSPENETKDCDFNNDNIIGKKESIQQENIETDVYINSALLDYSKNYNGTLKVEIKEDSTAIIEFNYDFEQPLNIKDAKIEKQPSSSGFGYLIVEGLNYTKTLAIDRINSSNTQVCIINRQISDISEFTSKCNSPAEILINCPGKNSTFTCNITDNKFIVSGLSGSAVREISLPEINLSETDLPLINITSICKANWECAQWSTCTSNFRTRKCTDLNSCGTTASKPQEKESCTSFSPPCEPNWECTSWQPKKCPAGKQQTKKCTDLNSCGVTTSIPSETKTCEYNPSSSAWKLIISFMVTLIVAIMSIITYLIIKKPFAFTASQMQYSSLTALNPK